ncbi:lipase family alpha/beta hydrolase [Dactylosporangium sp. CS-033363]|uniref:lipase family alpha/beta hydrolase n=1 Tax=Dactylosporangium sp. CS-033363 TaxID=3239935 RepID=UPI003D8F74C7
MARTYVLVHGAFHGGWCWAPLAEALTAAGHAVLAPTLSDDADLERHIAEVVSTADLAAGPVTLVGHSYGGIVARGAADRVGVERLVLLDAPVAADGESALDVHPRGAEFAARAVERGGITVLPVPGSPRLGIRDPDVRLWAERRLRPQPFACLAQPLRLSGGRTPPVTYIRCTGNPAPRPYLDRVHAAGWPLLDLDAGHDAMLDAPQALAHLLLEEC